MLSFVLNIILAHISMSYVLNVLIIINAISIGIDCILVYLITNIKISRLSTFSAFCLVFLDSLFHNNFLFYFQILQNTLLKAEENWALSRSMNLKGLLYMFSYGCQYLEENSGEDTLCGRSKPFFCILS